MLKLIVVICLVVIIGVPIAASQVLPWWGTLVVLAGEVTLLMVLGPKLIAHGVQRFVRGLLVKKSRVLRGARVEIHSVARVEKPAEEPESADAEGAPQEPGEPDESRYVLVDLTVSPTPGVGAGAMQYYDPTELLLVPADAEASIDEDPAADEQAAFAWRVCLLDASGEETDEFDKVTGPQRLRITFACPPELRGRVKFRYYFEQFGELTLPE